MVHFRNALLAVFIVLGGLPLWGGCEAQRAFVTAMEELESAAGGQIRVESSFERGWLRSRATTRIAPSEPGEPGGLGPLTFHHRLVHGPVPFGELLEGRWPDGLVGAIVDTSFALGPDASDLPLPELRALTRIELDGSARVEFESEPRRTEDGSLAWEGVRGTLMLPGGRFESVTGLVRAPRLELRTPGGTLTVEDVSMEVDTDSLAEDLPLGSFSIHVERVAFEGPAERMSLSGLRFVETGAVDVINAKYKLTVGAGFELLEIGEERYGPGRFELVLRNLDPEALKAVSASAQQGTGAGDPEAQAQAQLQAAMQALPRLLRSSPELELTQLDFEGDAGVLRVRALLGVDGDDERVLMGPLLAMMAIHAKADAYASAELLHAVVEAIAASRLREAGFDPDALADGPSRLRAARNQILTALEASGLVVVEPAGYRMRVDYRDGQLILNGVTTDPAALTTTAQLLR